MTSDRTIGVGIIGLGFMGRTHLAAYNRARDAGLPCRVAALCDTRDPGAGATGDLASGPADAPAIDAPGAALYASPEELLADPAVDLVSVCTYTDTHVDLAERALRARKHVLVEKPVATTSAPVERLAAAARASDRLCMPAMCMRFWPAWRWLRDRIADGTLGALTGLTLSRLSEPPRWSPRFYLDTARSGGALVDLHIHDTDFVRWCLGVPDSVVCVGTTDHVTTVYRFASGGPRVVAEGAWTMARGFGFRMRYLASFELATADFELGRDPELIVWREGERHVPALPAMSGYDGEVRHLLGAIGARGPELDATMDQAVEVARILDAERASQGAGGAPVRIG